MHGGLERRKFLRALPIGVAIAWPALASGTDPKAKAKTKEENEEVTPTEDLMREHGILKRILLAYDEVRRRIGAGEAFPTAAVAESATVIRSFIEQYHEKLEEDQLFPRFRKRGRLVDLVATLERQHRAGRVLTDQILALSRGGARTGANKQALSGALGQFGRMYAPHEAREDTVLFPAFREIVTAHEYDALGEEFEKREHQLFGSDGFEGMVSRVAGIEKQLGIYDLDQFTPRG